MAELVTADDLLFAALRARWLSSPEEVAAHFLDAAKNTACLDGVTALQVRVQAGTVLWDSGHKEQAISILRAAVDGSKPGTDAKARLVLAMALGEIGDRSGAESMAMSCVSAYPVGSLEAINTLEFVARSLVRGGQHEAAQLMADKAVSAAKSSRERGFAKRVALETANHGRNLVVEEVRRARLGDLRPLPADRLRAEPVARFDVADWPVLVDGLLVWWPEADYQRLVRQFAQLGDILGQTWDEHTARIEVALGAAAESPGRKRAMVPGECVEFVAFAERENADPASGSTMTAYAKIASAARQPANWPPRSRQPCWCGSGRRYSDCHHRAR